MNHYGIILRKLRELNFFTIKQAAKKIGRSSGWISQIENGKVVVRLDYAEFERIVAVYNGEPYRKQFGAWIARAKVNEETSREISYNGPILKYLRRKANLTLETVAKKAEISFGHLSDLENGEKRVSENLKNRLMKIYGYSPASFRNFTGEDKRASSIPIRYKLNILLGKLTSGDIEKVFNFINEQISGR